MHVSTCFVYGNARERERERERVQMVPWVTKVTMWNDGPDWIKMGRLIGKNEEYKTGNTVVRRLVFSTFICITLTPISTTGISAQIFIS